MFNQNGPKAVDLALKSFSRIDALILNHGTLSPVKRIADSDLEEWRSAFDVNFFSALAFVSLPWPPSNQILTPSRSNQLSPLSVSPVAVSSLHLPGPQSPLTQHGAHMALPKLL